ncbi:MAG: pilus assembly protein [Peptoniphilaceae bacterium]|nr:pilus assembly protein [Peptoniphilaceae bacterium]MDY6085866.1 TadE/TadG family type IV pilus assembly protein [Peptoniphilaceae bacterium]
MMRWRDARGVMTVEASLVLSLFILAMISWILLTNLLTTEAMMQQALDQAALRVADHLSAVHTLTGNEGAVGKFAEAMQLKRPDVPVGNVVEEVIADLGATIDSHDQVSHFYGRGTGLPQAIRDQRFSADVDDALDELTLDWEARMDLPGLLRPLGPLQLRQKSTVGIWVLTDDPIVGLDGDAKKEEQKETPTSVWQQPPFSRGRVLVEWRRQTSGARRIKSGQVMDLYHSGREIESVISMNLFARTYATGSGIDVKGYTLKSEAIEKNLESKVNQILEAAEKRPTLEMEDGSPVQTEGAALRLSVIVPEEAKHFERELNTMAHQLEEKRGVRIRYYYREKALLPKAEEPEVPKGEEGPEGGKGESE